MIKDIPASEEFDSAAKAQLDFAWDIVISFLVTLEEVGTFIEVDKEDKSAFWEKSRQRILTSLIIAQQGAELAIKGKLVAVSPYLLIAENPSDWPKDVDGTGISFSDFRTIDAQDLIKVHNTTASSKLDDGFVNLFGKLRKLRNKAMHTVDPQFVVSAQEVITILLDVHNYLYPAEKWVSTRREFLHDSPATHILFGNEPVESTIVKEFLTVFNYLEPAQVEKFFKVDKKQRLYLCPECKQESKKYEMIEPKYAVLRPNDPNSKSLYCFVCDKQHLITRQKCKFDNCLGNVVSDDYFCCCTCGEYQG